MEIKKGDKIVLVDIYGYKTLDTMTDYFEVEGIKEERGKLKIFLKFKYNSLEAYNQAKEMGKITKGFGEWFHIAMSFTRDDAMKFIRKHEHQYKIIKP